MHDCIQKENRHGLCHELLRSRVRSLRPPRREGGRGVGAANREALLARVLIEDSILFYQRWKGGKREG